MRRISTYVFLHASQLYDTLVDCSFCNQTVNCDLTSLSQSVGAVHCLCVVGWIPVVIIEDNSVCGGQIDTQTTSTSTKQEDEDIWPAIRLGTRQMNMNPKGQTEFASP